MQGLIPINKPQGWTSFDVVAALRRHLGIKRVGHSGTLDPMATGVLPVFAGRVTRLIDRLPVTDKRYRATLRLGVTTDTLDITGQVIRTVPSAVTLPQLEAALAPFRGPILQIPPMTSALKHEGKRLYDLARAGQTVERPARPVTVYDLTCLGQGEGPQDFVLDVRCSKGTYVRSLCDDIGRALGCGGTLAALCRTEAAGLTLDDCLTVDEARATPPEALLRPVDGLFASLPGVELTAAQHRRFQNGGALDGDRLPALPAADGSVRVLFAGRLVALGRWDAAAGQLKPDCYFFEES